MVRVCLVITNRLSKFQLQITVEILNMPVVLESCDWRFFDIRGLKATWQTASHSLSVSTFKVE